MDTKSLKEAIRGEKESEYDKQAREFLEKTGTAFSAKLVGHDKYFPDDKETRDIYEITLVRDKKTWTFRDGQSIAKSGAGLENKPIYFREVSFQRERALKAAGYELKNGGYARKRIPPTPYDVLACLTKYDPGTFDDFCADYGYDTDSRKANNIYLDVQKEWTEVNRLFGDVLDDLAEIN